MAIQSIQKRLLCFNRFLSYKACAVGLITACIFLIIRYLYTNYPYSQSLSKKNITPITPTSQQDGHTAPPTPELSLADLLAKDSKVASIVQSLNTTESTEKRIKLLDSLIDAASSYQWRSREHILIVELFFEHFVKLPEEQIFPINKGNSNIKDLFIKLGKDINSVPAFSSPLTDGLAKFYKYLIPTQEERFVKLLPLNQLIFNRRANIREFSRRNDLGEINTQVFQEYFDPYLKNHPTPYLIFNGAYIFIPAVSTNLLRRIFTCYHATMNISFDVVNAFNKIPLDQEAYEKLLVFVDWYKKNAEKWPAYSQASRLFNILQVASNLMKKLTANNIIYKLRSREITGRKVLLLTPSIIKNWIPEKYSSWNVFKANSSDIYHDSDVEQFF